MKNFFCFILLSLFSVAARSQSYMKNAADENLSNSMSISYQYLGDTYVGAKTTVPAYFAGDGYDPTRKYDHSVLWNNSATQWEFKSQSGAIDSEGPTLRSVNTLAAWGDGVYYNYNFISTGNKYPACGGWTNGAQMTGMCVPAVKLVISSGSTIDAYNGQIMYIKRKGNFGAEPTTYLLNGHPRYVGKVGADSLQFIYKDGEWHFMTKLASSNAAWNGRIAADWTSRATNSSDTDLVPPTGWNIPGGGTLGINGSAAPLPVSLTKFDAKAMPNKTVKINWATTEEVNASHFSVERSRDSKTFTEIARKESSVNSKELKTYEVIDDSPSFGTNYYRLRQVDLDGKSQVYRIVAATVSDQDQPFGAFPNPASSKQFSLKVENADEAQVTLYDVLGIQHAASAEKESDYVLVVKPKGRLTPGMYMAHVKNLTGSYTHKVYIQN